MKSTSGTVQNTDMFMFRGRLRSSGLERSPLQGPLETLTCLRLEVDFVGAGSSEVQLRDHSKL